MEDTKLDHGQERVMGDDDFIVSKTDPKGLITYCNRLFIEFSGYSESELLGAPYSIIRHPDMPKGIFKLMWKSLSDGREFFCYIKNRSKDGFYWTFANATPSLDSQGQLMGYYSVRRKPRREIVERLEPLYRAMLEDEQNRSGDAGINASLARLDQHVKTQGEESYEDFILAL